MNSSSARYHIDVRDFQNSEIVSSQLIRRYLQCFCQIPAVLLVTFSTLLVNKYCWFNGSKNSFLARQDEAISSIMTFLVFCMIDPSVPVVFF